MSKIRIPKIVEDEQEIKSPHLFMTVTYLVSLSIIAALSFTVHIMLNRVINEQSSNSGLINISGQQRMLSQRSSLFALEYLMTGSFEAKEQALKALETLKKNHQELISDHVNAIRNMQPSPLSSNLQHMYFEAPVSVDAKLAAYSTLLVEALSQQTLHNNGPVVIDQLPFLASAKQPLLDAFNQMVYQYEHESQERINKLRNIQNVVLIMIILTIFAEALFIFRPMVRKVVFYAKRLEYESQHDAISGLYNRRAFNTFFNNLLAQSQRYKSDLSLMSLDIDFFKKVNDTYGHDIGDKVICHVSQLIYSNTRECDVLARVGGEEFSLLLPSTMLEQAVSVAEKIRAIIAATPLCIDNRIIEITISIGVTQIIPNDEQAAKALKRADDALYSSKKQGRNRVTSLRAVSE